MEYAARPFEITKIERNRPKPSGPEGNQEGHPVPDILGGTQDVISGHGRPLRSPVRRAVTTVLRQGEFLRLGWNDIDLEKGMLRVRHTLTAAGFPKGAPATLTAPKTPRGRRSVMLTKVAVNALHRHSERQYDEQCCSRGLITSSCSPPSTLVLSITPLLFEQDSSDIYNAVTVTVRKRPASNRGLGVSPANRWLTDGARTRDLLIRRHSPSVTGVDTEG